MLLQKLVEYGGRTPTDVPARYKGTRVKYAIYLREDGTNPSMVELSDGETTGKKNRGKELIVPNVSRTVGIKPNLLVDKAEYVLGIARDPEKADKTPVRHAQFIAQVGDCADSTREPSVRAVLRFLQAKDDGVRLPDDFDPTANVTFVVTTAAGDIRPVDLPAVRKYWAARKGDAQDASDERFECLVCGARGPVEKTLELKVRRIPNGQPTGTALVSFNAPAFTSYGLQQTQNAPICGSCGEGFSKSLNTLIEDPSTSIRVGAVQYVFWTREPVGVAWADFFQQPDPQQIAELYQSMKDGRPGATAVNAAEFFAAALTANGGRAVLRDWIDTTVGHAKESLLRYFDAQRLVDDYGRLGRPLPLWRLANATLRLDSQGRPSARDREAGAAPSVAPALLRFALAGTPLPPSLVWDAVQRSRAEQRVLRERAVLIKLTLRSRDRTKGETWMDALDASTEDVAYRCGRLLAVIEEVQRAALGDVNATVVDRFYGTASTAPIAVFSRLLKGAQPHLAKLRRDRPGTYRALDARLQEVLAPVHGFPSALNLEQQGLFALGYYHQRAEDRRQAIERAAARAAATGSAQADDLSLDDSESK
jgi:CRISPR-associated protein Csd1